MRGKAPYLLIFETKQYEQFISHLKSMGVRITGETQGEHQRSAFIHPSSANGALLEIIEVSGGSNPLPAAGPGWQKQEPRPLPKQMRQVAPLVRDLEEAIRRWSEMFGLCATSRFEVSFTNLEIAVMPWRAWTPSSNWPNRPRHALRPLLRALRRGNILDYLSD